MEGVAETRPWPSSTSGVRRRTDDQARSSITGADVRPSGDGTFDGDRWGRFLT